MQTNEAKDKRPIYKWAQDEGAAITSLLPSTQAV